MLEFTEAQRAMIYSSQGHINSAWFLYLAAGTGHRFPKTLPLDVAACLEFARPGFDGRMTIEKSINRVRTGMAHAPIELHSLIERAIATLEIVGVPTDPLDADVEAAMLALQFQSAYAAVPYWIAKEGVAFALRAFVAGHGYEHSHFKHNYTAKGDWITKSWDACASVEYAESGWKFLRCFAAMLDAVDYRALVGVVEELRPAVPLAVRLGMDFVIPTERAWIDADIAEAFANPKTWNGSARHFVTLCNLQDAVRAPAFKEAYYAEDHLLNVLAQHGADGGAQVLHAMLEHAPNNDKRKEYIKVLATAISVEAGNVMAQWLLNKATLPAATKYFVQHPALVDSVLVPLIAKGGKLGAAAAVARDTAVSKSAGKKGGHAASVSAPNTESAMADDPQVPAELPTVLRRPPWQQRAAAPVALTLTMLPYEDAYPITAATQAAVAAEQRKWAEQRMNEAQWSTEENFIEWVSSRYNLPLSWVAHVQDIALLPQVLQARRSRSTYHIGRGVRAILQWHGIAALSAVLDYAEADLEECMKVLAEVDSPRVAATFARALAKKSLRRSAEQWLTANARLATWGLLPAAFAPISKKTAADRAAAQSALMLIKRNDRGGEATAVAALYGVDAARAFEALDPLQDVPTKIPTLPPFAMVSELPPLRCTDGTPFGSIATERFLTMLSFGITSTSVYGGIADVQAAAEPASLTAFLWALFERWQAAGTPSTADWALRALGLVGDDTVVRKLVPLIRAWPKEKALARAAVGIDVLGHIGTDLALMSIDALATESRYDSIRERAGETISGIAATRGLSTAALADRLAPTLNLDANGTCELMVGDARYRVGFDAYLLPSVQLLDAAGHATAAPLAELPKARKGDEAGAASHVRWKALRADAKAAAKREIARLERAMVDGRSWTADEFNRLLLHHPLMQHLARRLLWRATELGQSSVLFRVAEDRTLADAADASYELPATAAVTLPHPLRCTVEELATWARIFADYEVLAPFEQLTRAVERCTAGAQRDQVVADVLGRGLPAGDVRRLRERGWRTDGDSWCSTMVRDLGADVVALQLEPGFAADLAEIEDQKATSLTLLRDNATADWRIVDDVTFSELLRELRE